MADGLLEPDDRLVRAGASVGFFVSVFGLATSIPSWCKWNNNQQSQGRSRDMCELFGFIQGIDVVELSLDDRPNFVANWFITSGLFSAICDEFLLKDKWSMRA